MDGVDVRILAPAEAMKFTLARTREGLSLIHIYAKLTYQDGQVAGQKTATVVAGGVDTTNVEFTNTNPWPAGKYTVVVTLNGQPVGLAQDIEVK